MDKEFYCLMDGNKLIGLDESSGGYPWTPSYPCGIKYWAKREEAEKYNKIFKNMFKLVKVKLSVVEV